MGWDWSYGGRAGTKAWRFATHRRRTGDARATHKRRCSLRASGDWREIGERSTPRVRGGGGGEFVRADGEYTERRSRNVVNAGLVELADVAEFADPAELADLVELVQLADLAALTGPSPRTRHRRPRSDSSGPVLDRHSSVRISCPRRGFGATARDMLSAVIEQAKETEKQGKRN